MADSTIIKSLNGLEIYDEASREMISGVTASSTDGAAYIATVKGIKSLASGVNFVMVPNKNAAGDDVTLNVNGLGAKSVKRKLSNSPASTVTDSIEEQIRSGVPVRVTYNGSAWLVDDVYPNLTSGTYGTLPVASGGTGVTTPEAERDRLGLGNTTDAVPVANGGTGAATAAAALNNLGITWGTAEAPATGTPGSIYIQIN